SSYAYLAVGRVPAPQNNQLSEANKLSMDCARRALADIFNLSDILISPFRLRVNLLYLDVIAIPSLLRYPTPALKVTFSEPPEILIWSLLVNPVRRPKLRKSVSLKIIVSEGFTGSTIVCQPSSSLCLLVSFRYMVV